jgi:hypothetical protein
MDRSQVSGNGSLPKIKPDPGQIAAAQEAQKKVDSHGNEGNGTFAIWFWIAVFGIAYLPWLSSRVISFVNELF